MEEVLINHMYSGDFLKKDNLGHEIINLFKSDNDNHYIYAMSGGDYAGTHKGKIKTVIMVRNVDEFRAEVLAKADVEEDVFGDELEDADNYVMIPGVRELESGFMSNLKFKTRAEVYRSNHIKQINYIKDKNVKYGGVYLNEFFAGNRIDSLEHTIYITFKVNNFRFAKKPVFLCDKRIKGDEEHLILSGRDRMCGASVADFISKNDPTIKELLDGDYWEGEDTSKKVDVSKINWEPSFLDILKKRNDEIIYSNWIAYYLKNDVDLTKKFIKEVLGIETSCEKLQVVRESNDNIDIWIEDEDSIIVIENKIKSSINGRQIISTGETVEKKQFSQLKKYYEYATEIAKQYGKKVSFFILLPDYAYKNTTPLEKYDKFTEYTVKRYSELLKFFKDNKTSLPFYNQFIISLESQSNQYSNDLYIEMLNRFQSAIRLNK